MNKNQFRNLIVEFHILQSFPVTCLNRDDVGAPKTAMVGGTTSLPCQQSVLEALCSPGDEGI